MSAFGGHEEVSECLRRERVLLHLVSPGIISVILWEEGQRSLHQTPGPKQWGCSAWTAPRRSHLPQREWSPFVSYCGMRRQIDEGPLIPSGSALRQQAKATVPHPPPRRLSPTFSSHVTDKAAKLGGTGQGKCPEEMMSWHPWSLRGRANKKDWGKKTKQKKKQQHVFLPASVRTGLFLFGTARPDCDSASTSNPLSRCVGVSGLCGERPLQKLLQSGCLGVERRADVVSPVPPTPTVSPEGKVCRHRWKGSGQKGWSLWHGQNNRAALVSMASQAASLSRLSLGHKIWLCATRDHRQHGPLFSLLIQAELCTLFWISGIDAVGWSFSNSLHENYTKEWWSVGWQWVTKVALIVDDCDNLKSSQRTKRRIYTLL